MRPFEGARAHGGGVGDGDHWVRWSCVGGRLYVAAEELSMAEKDSFCLSAAVAYHYKPTDKRNACTQ